MYNIHKITYTQPPNTCSKLTIQKLEQGEKYVQKFIIKTPEQCHCHHFGVFIVNFEYISHLALVFLLLTLST